MVQALTTIGTKTRQLVRWAIFKGPEKPSSRSRHSPTDLQNPKSRKIFEGHESSHTIPEPFAHDDEAFDHLIQSDTTESSPQSAQFEPDRYCSLTTYEGPVTDIRDQHTIADTRANEVHVDGPQKRYDSRLVTVFPFNLLSDFSLKRSGGGFKLLDTGRRSRRSAG